MAKKRNTIDAKNAIQKVLIYILKTDKGECEENKKVDLPKLKSIRLERFYRVKKN